MWFSYNFFRRHPGRPATSQNETESWVTQSYLRFLASMSLQAMPHDSKFDTTHCVPSPYSQTLSCSQHFYCYHSVLRRAPLQYA